MHDGYWKTRFMIAFCDEYVQGHIYVQDHIAEVIEPSVAFTMGSRLIFCVCMGGSHAPKFYVGTRIGHLIGRVRNGFSG
jgi:hypothetical protein